jgi:hypothetical protein
MAENDTETPDEKIARLETQLTEVRSEAAKQRVAKRTAVEDAKAQLKADLEAEFNSKLEAATKSQTETASEVSNSKLQIAKLKAALTTVFDEATTGRVLDLASRLQGDSDETLGEDAKRLKSLYGLDARPKTPASDPTQGTGNAIPLNSDKLVGMLEQAFNKH